MDFSQFEREFTTSEKLRAFMYHVYIVTLGGIFEPEKYDIYVDTFNKFMEYKKQQRQGAQADSE